MSECSVTFYDLGNSTVVAIRPPKRDPRPSTDGETKAATEVAEPKDGTAKGAA